MPQAPAGWLPWLFAVIFAGGYSMQATVMPVAASDVFSGERFAVVYGFIAIATYGGAAFGPWLAGYVFDVGGSYAVAFVVAIIASVLACAILCLTLRRPVGTIRRGLAWKESTT